MQLSRYEPSEPPEYLKQTMSNTVMFQQYRNLTIQKPLPLNQCPSILTKPQSSYKPFEIVVPPLKNQLLKRKIIKKIRSERIDEAMEKKAQELLSVHLLWKLNRSTLDAVRQGIPPPFSILDTKEEGDYLPDGEKKEFPHFSNTLKPTEIPILNKPAHLPRPKKLSRPPPSSVDQTCTFKIKTLYQFPKLLFKHGNQKFDLIAQELPASESNTKLLYDLFNDYFNFEDRIDTRGEEQRKKYLKRVRRFLVKAFGKYRKKEGAASVYMPMEEEILSLKDIRERLDAKRQESESSEDD